MVSLMQIRRALLVRVIQTARPQTASPQLDGRGGLGRSPELISQRRWATSPLDTTGMNAQPMFLEGVWK